MIESEYINQAVKKDFKAVIFQFDKELFAIPISYVNEIIYLVHITPLPGSQEHLLGLINLRGKIIPIIDVRILLGLNISDSTKNTRIIIIHLEKENLGFLVDSVNDVSDINCENLELTIPSISNVKEEYIVSLAKKNDTFITVLNIERVFINS